MYKLVIAALIVMLQVSVNTAQGVESLVPESMTAAELWNPFAWYYPFGIASANAWADYLKNAQKATNQLYQHVQAVSNPATNAANKAPGAAPSNPTPQGKEPPTNSAPQETEKPKEDQTQNSDSS